MTRKEIAREAFIQGLKHGRGSEEYPDVTIRAADTAFENWWEQNHEGEEAYSMVGLGEVEHTIECTVEPSEGSWLYDKMVTDDVQGAYE